MKDSFNHRGQILQEMHDHIEEYYIAQQEPPQPDWFGSDFSKEQYYMLKWIYHGMCLGKKPNEKLSYPDMYNKLTALMRVWNDGIAKRRKQQA